MNTRKFTMKTEEEIVKKLKAISADERLGYEAANVQVNAPLALIQTDLRATARALRWVMGYIDT
jgi:hypothetical protein